MRNKGLTFVASELISAAPSAGCCGLSSARQPDRVRGSVFPSYLVYRGDNWIASVLVIEVGDWCPAKRIEVEAYADN